MCMATAYLSEGTGSVVLLKEVASVVIEGQEVQVMSLFGEEKNLRGRIREVDFLHSTVLFEGQVVQGETDK